MDKINYWLNLGDPDVILAELRERDLPARSLAGKAASEAMLLLTLQKMDTSSGRWQKTAIITGSTVAIVLAVAQFVLDHI